MKCKRDTRSQGCEPKPLFWEPRINLTWPMGVGGGVVGEIGKDRGEGEVNCGNIGEGSWVRDFP